MFCSKCGANNKDGVKFCSTCGAEMVQTAFVQPVQPQTNIPTNSSMTPLSDTPINPYAQPMVDKPINPYEQPVMNKPINPYEQPQENQPEGSVDLLKSMTFETRMAKKKFLYHPANEGLLKTLRMEMMVSWALIGLSVIVHLIEIIKCISTGERKAYFPARFWPAPSDGLMSWMSLEWVFINEYIGYVIILHVVLALILLLSYHKINFICGILFVIVSLVPLLLGYLPVAALVVCAILYAIQIFTINRAYRTYFQRGSIS